MLVVHLERHRPLDLRRSSRRLHDHTLGQLANGTLGDACGFGVCKTTAQDVIGLTGLVTRISAGFNTSYASTSDAMEWAWGANADGQLGHAPGSSGDILNCAGAKGRCNPVVQAYAVPSTP